jgi:hypothetical protein
VNDNGQMVGVITSTASANAFLNLTGSLPQNISWAVRGEYAAALIDGPPTLPILKGRSAVINRVKGASCMILAEPAK